VINLVYADTTFSDNPDDILIMSNSSTTFNGATGGITGEVIEETIGGTNCLYKWNCTNWEVCSPSEKQIRNCTNVGTCLDEYKPPKTNQSCNYTSQNSNEENKKSGTEYNNVIFYWAGGMIILLIAICLIKKYFRK